MGRSLVTQLFTCTAGALFPSAALAFCGTYVGGADSELYNEVSQVAMVRQGTTTTLSVYNDVHGDTDDFALVIPVPSVLQEDQVHVLDPEIFDRLDQYSTPRLVSYQCSDFEHEDDWGMDGGGESGGGEEGGGGGGGDVDVEAEYIVGEYAIVVLSATQSLSLFSWLDKNGYSVPETSLDILQDYLDAGSYFLAAKVDESAEIGDGDALSPLQFRYDVELYGLPIRIGTLNAREAQDLLIYAINDWADGHVAVANYTQVTVEEECLWESEDDQSFADYYAEKFANAYADAGDGVWMHEYTWGQGNCDPCTGEPPNATDLATLGFDNSNSTYGDEFFFTRIHMRYSPSEADQDLILYQSGIVDNDQIRFIEYEPYLEDRFPICEQGWAEDPGSCDDEEDYGSDTNEPFDTAIGGSGSGESDDHDIGSGCQSGEGCSMARTQGKNAIWLLGVVLWLRRSRQPEIRKRM